MHLRKSAILNATMTVHPGSRQAAANYRPAACAPQQQNAFDLEPSIFLAECRSSHGEIIEFSGATTWAKQSGF